MKNKTACYLADTEALKDELMQMLMRLPKEERTKVLAHYLKAITPA